MEKKRHAEKGIWKQRLKQAAAAVAFLAAFFSHVEWEDYQIIRQISFGEGDNRETVVDVFAPGPQEPRNIAEKIRREYIAVNHDGLPEQLVIRFYRTDWHMEQRRVFAKIVFDADSFK